MIKRIVEIWESIKTFIDRPIGSFATSASVLTPTIGVSLAEVQSISVVIGAVLAVLISSVCLIRQIVLLRTDLIRNKIEEKELKKSDREKGINI